MNVSTSRAPEMVTVETAQSMLLDSVERLPAQEVCSLDQAYGRVLAQDVTSTLRVPGFDNSAMDGYALNWDSTMTGPFPVVQRIIAGTEGDALAPAQAARIFTGAPVPPGANVVVPQEEVEREGESIRLMATVREGQHIRRAGEDIEVGEVILKAGTRLDARHLGLAASIGVAELPVYRRLRVAVFFTGNELVEPGQPLAPGMIYNTNRYALGALLKALGCELHDYGVVPDDPELLGDLLRTASQEHDVVMTSGGVSVGDEDHVKSVVSALGNIDIWQVAMKPGKPFVFGRIDEANFVGLPGNPVSAFVTFVLLAQPFLKARQGRDDAAIVRQKVPAAFTWHRKGRKREFVRVRCEHDAQDRLSVALSHPSQGSGVMTSIAFADGLVDVPSGTLVEPGDLVTFYPFSP